MRVFISSVISGFEEYRTAAASACAVLNHGVVRAEDWPARAQTPQQACLQGVRDSDVVVLLLGTRYGAVQASGLSATEEEFDEAARSKPVLIFDQLDVDRDDAMNGFVKRVQDWVGGALTKSFTTPDDLRDKVIAALADHALSELAGVVDADQITSHARSLLPQGRHGTDDVLSVAAAGGPEQQILRPGEIEAPDLWEDLKRDAMFGAHRVIDSNHGAQSGIERGLLIISNDRERIVVDPRGGIAVHVPARRVRNTMGMNPLIEEEIEAAVASSLSFIGATLDRIDSSHRLRIVVPLVRLQGAVLGWKTQAEDRANPNTMNMGFGRQSEEPIVLDPPTRPRQHLTHRAQELAQDFTVLLRHQIRP